MAVRAGVQSEEDEVAGEMSFWGRVSSLPVKKVVFRATGRPVLMPLSRLVTSRLGKHKLFFLAIEIAIVKIFMYITVILF